MNIIQKIHDMTAFVFKSIFHIFPLQHVSHAEVLTVIKLNVQLKTENSYLKTIPSTRAEDAKSSVACLALKCFSTLALNMHDFRGGGLLKIKCVF